MATMLTLHKAAQLNGTLYIYGGQATASEDQTTDTWSKSLEATEHPLAC